MRSASKTTRATRSCISRLKGTCPPWSSTTRASLCTADRKVTVHGNETIKVTKTEKQNYNADRKMTVEGANSDTIKGAHTGPTKRAGRRLSRRAIRWS